MTGESQQSERNWIWPVFTAGLVVGLGALTYWLLKTQGDKSQAGVDELIHLCENFADSLERSLGDGGTSAIAS